MPELLSGPAVETQEQKKIPLAEIQEYAAFWVQFTRDRFKEKLSKREKQGIQNQLEKFQATEDILLLLPKKLNTREQIERYLDSQIEELEAKFEHAQSPSYQDYIAKQREKVMAALQFMDNSDEKQNHSNKLFQRWRSNKRHQEWRGEKSVEFDHTFYEQLASRLEPKRQEAEAAGDEESALKYEHLLDQVFTDAHPERNPTISIELLNFVSNELTLAEKELKETKLGIKSSTPDELAATIILARDSRKNYFAVNKKKFLNIETQPSSFDEIQEIDHLVILVLKNASPLLPPLKKLLKQLKPQADELTWNDPNKLDIQITEALKLTDQAIEEITDEKRVEGVGKLKKTDVLHIIYEVKFRLESFHRLLDRRMNLNWLPKSEPIEDPSFIEEEANGEPWINKERERSYARVNEEIREATEIRGQSGGDYLYELIVNNAKDQKYRKQCKELFNDQIRQGIEVRIVTSDSLAKIAGRPIRRPVFVIKDPSVYQTLEAIFDHKPGTSHGLHFPPGVFPDDENWSKIGMILAHDNTSTIDHEVRHSADPFTTKDLNTRRGYNKLLAELFAEYTEVVSTSIGSNEETTAWRGVERLVGLRSYYKNFSKYVKEENRLSFEEWQELVEDCVGQMKVLCAQRGSVKAQKILAQCETVEQFLNTKF